MTDVTRSTRGARPPVEIREAAFGDIAQLCELLAELFAQESDLRPDAERQRRGLISILESPATGRIYCAVHSGEVVGTVMILFTVSTAEGGRAAWLEDMIVRRDWRRKGVGRLLLGAAIREAKAAGCSRVTLLTDATNDGAIRFYSGVGFVRSAMTPLRLAIA